MKKISKYILLVLVALLINLTPTMAKEINLKTLGDLVLEQEPNATSFYIIGKYVFTDQYVKNYSLNTKDIMLSARSIKVSEEDDGEVKSSPIYDKMNIYTVSKYSDGWKFNDNLIGSPKPQDDMLVDIKYIDYNLIKDVYTVTFVDDKNADIRKQEVISGERVTAPSVEVEKGYTLEWHKCNNDNCSSLEEDAFDFNTEITSDIKLKQVLVGDVYKLTFEDENIEGGKQEFSYTYPNVVPSDHQNLKPSDKEGYTFKYWYDVAVGEDTEFDFGQKLTQNVTLKAKWQIETYTVTFINESSSEEKTVEYNHTVEMPTEPQRKGFTFGGWFKCSDDECNSLEETAFDFDTPIKANIKLKAKWTEKQLIVKFKGMIDDVENNQFVQGKDTVVLNSNHKLTTEQIPNTEQTGYEFLGWFDEKHPNTEIKILTDRIFTDEVTTIIGKWKTNRYTVTFDSDGGDVIGERIVSYNSQVQSPGEAHKNAEGDYNGYEFIGWFKCSDDECNSLEETAFDFNTPITEDITLKAKYEKIVYTNKIVNNFVDSINNKDFSATVQQEENKISFNIINKNLDLQTNYSKVKSAIEKAVKVKNVTDITIEYNGTSKKTITLTSTSNIDSELVELFKAMIADKDFGEIKLEDLYNKSLDVTINLAAGYKNEEKNSVDTYNVEFITNFVKVSNIQELKDNLSSGKEIIVENWEGETITNTIYIDHDVVIDFRNTTVKSAVTDSKYTFVIKSGKNVSIKDLKLEIDAILPSEYDKELKKAITEKNTIGIKVEENASLTVNNFNVITNKNLDRNAFKIGGEDFNSTKVAINENAAIELHGTLYGSNINYDAEIYGSPTVLAAENAIMDLRGLSKSTYIYNVKRTDDKTKGSSDRFDKVEGFIHYYKDYNNSYITFVFYSTSSPQAVFALLYNENIIIPKVFQEDGNLYMIDGKPLQKWVSRNYSGSKTTDELANEKIKNHETIYLYAKYE